MSTTTKVVWAAVVGAFALSCALVVFTYFQTVDAYDIKDIIARFVPPADAQSEQDLLALSQQIGICGGVYCCPISPLLAALAFAATYFALRRVGGHTSRAETSVEGTPCKGSEVDDH